MGAMAVVPRSRTGMVASQNKDYPHLLKGLPVTEPNLGWCADVTYPSIRGGFMHWVAVDWATRVVLS